MKYQRISNLYGMRVYENPHLIVEDGTEERKRTWKERLFSRPWRPFKKTRTVTKYKPDPYCYIMDLAAIGNPCYNFNSNNEDKNIVCHPVTAVKIRKVIGEYNKSSMQGNPSS